jgi:hypothetical protein
VELDFSKLENIAYRGFEGEKARAEKDKLIEQGFTILEGATTPFDAPPAQEAYTPIPPPEKARKGQLRPFTGIDKSRNYRAMYRAACDFHERHNPPTIDGEYWRTHKPGEDEEPQAELDYWENTVEDISATAGGFNNDPFITGLLVAIFEELEREYRALKDAIRPI